MLAFDTSGPFVCVGTTVETCSGGVIEAMARGQAEALMPMIEARRTQCGWAWSDVDAIGVGIGPGNFTGIRISVAAARGLGLALGIPVFGLTGFEIACGRDKPAPGTLVSLPAPRNMAYVQGFDLDGATLFGPGRLIDPDNPPADLKLPHGMEIVGFRAQDIATHFHVTATDTAEPLDPHRIADITASKYRKASAFPPAPTPLYIKPADAAPARDAPPVLLP